MDQTVQFRWLGVAGIELRVNEHILAIDPFVTRPSFRRMWWGRIHADRALVATTVPQCDFVLVTHAHWDHLMDVPEVVRQTGAVVLGSHNTCQLLSVLGVAPAGLCEIQVGDQFPLGHFQVKVLAAEHRSVPGFAPGPLSPALWPPLRMRDYRMDSCFSFLIQASGLSFLDWSSIRSEPALSADVLWVNPGADAAYYEALLAVVQPRIILPLHWDDLFRSVSKPVRPSWKPPRLTFPPLSRVDLARFCQMIEQIAPQTHVCIPEIFHLYDLSEVLSERANLASRESVPPA